MQSVPTLAATSTIAVAAVGLNFASPSESRQYDHATRPTTSRSSIMSRLTSSTRSSSRQLNPHPSKPNGISFPRDPSPLHSHPPSSYMTLSTRPVTSSAGAQDLSQPRRPRLSLTSALSSISNSSSPQMPALPRNKLVKRSASQRAPSTRPQTRSERRVSSFPRPSTSHPQGFASTGPGVATSEVQLDDEAHLSNVHVHFFRPKVAAADHALELDSFGGSPFVRRICPDQTSPTLVMGGLLRSSELDVDRRLDGLADSPSPWASRPPTSSNTLSHSSPVQSQSTPAEDTETRGRRSFSINHLFRQPSSEKPKKLLRRKSRRLFSAQDGSADFSKDVQMPDPLKASLAITLEERSAPKSPQLPMSSNSSPPTPPFTSHSRPSRPSTTPSEINSSQVGSDTGTRVFSSSDEDELDFRSETNYDSVRTAFTKTAKPTNGPALQTLFSPPPELPEVSEVSDRSSNQALADSPGTIIPRGPKSNTEEESSNSTPVRTVVAHSPERSHKHSSPHPKPGDSNLAGSSQAQKLSLGKLAWNPAADDEELDWSGDDADDNWSTPKTSVADKDPSRQLAWGETTLAPMQTSHSPTRAGRSPSAYGPKSSLFDWAEQPTATNSGSNTPPRPKTVHGKKEPDLRGSRSTGRRAPSGLHTRSHSVPVIVDPAAQRTNVTNKFGTWGIGSKGVTEDWDDDFDFDEPQKSVETSAPVTDARPAKLGMHVPTVILTAQNNVLANISLLREWGLLIEELKDLRVKAGNLEIPMQQYEGTFDEVDAMIDLADQEAEDEGISGIKARTSPGQVYDDGFDELDDDRWNSPTKVTGIADDDVFGIVEAGSPRTSTSTSRLSSQLPIRTRPRKDSEAVARSVIEELHRRRSAQDPKLSKGPKMEFDTATLKHIVPYVNGLMRKVKEILRETEGLNPSPEHQRQSRGRPLSAIFDEEGLESPSAGRFKGRQDFGPAADQSSDEYQDEERGDEIYAQ